MALVQKARDHDAGKRNTGTTTQPETEAQRFPLHCLPPVCEAMARALCQRCAYWNRFRDAASSEF